MIASNVVVYSIRDATPEGRIVEGAIILAIIAAVFFVLRRK